MDVSDLQNIDPNVDYNTILPLQQKRTIAFINAFINETVCFLNHFAQSCEARLLQFEYKIQKIEASLLILESQLSSVPEINQVIQVPDFANQPDIINENMNTHIAEVQPAGVPQAHKDVRFSKFFKMVQVGVPPQAVKLKMEVEGFDPLVLDTPHAVIPEF